MPVFDVIFRDALIYDGTGAPPRRDSLAITGERIAAVGSVFPNEAREVVEAGDAAQD